MSNNSNTDDEKRKQDDIEHTENIVASIVNVIDNSFDRISKYNDPVTKHIVFVDKIIMFLDFMNSMVKSEINNINPILIDKLNKSFDKIRKQFDLLTDWIQSPHYDPDHPYGKKLMELSEQDLNHVLHNSSN